jgi:hypothetical protein
MWSRPVSRILWSATIYLCGLPGGCLGRLAVCRNERAARASCLALLRTGFTEPHRSLDALVSSYLTFSPLPRHRSAEAVRFLWHFPRVAPPGISPASCPTESGLSSTRPPPESGVPAAAARPTPRHKYATTQAGRPFPCRRQACYPGERVRFIRFAARSRAPRSGRPSTMQSTAFPTAPAASQPNEVAA